MKFFGHPYVFEFKIVLTSNDPQGWGHPYHWVTLYMALTWSKLPTPNQTVSLLFEFRFFQDFKSEHENLRRDRRDAARHSKKQKDSQAKSAAHASSGYCT